MKSYLAIITAAGLAVGVLNAFAGEQEEINVTGSSSHYRLDSFKKGPSRDELAINSCFEAFVARILPGAEVTIRAVTSEHEPVFDRHGSIIQSVAMRVSMTATAASDGAVLATGSCRVNRSAKVAYVKTSSRDSERLASLTPDDLRLVAAIR